MELVTPGIGLIFWTAVSFLILVFLLAKFAWKPILSSVEERTASIKDALNAAENAKEEMQKLISENEKLLVEARIERDKMLRDAKTAADKMIATAQDKAKAEGERLMLAAKEAIQNEKKAALIEVKNQVAILSLEIAEKILRKKLESGSAQKELVDDLIKEVNLN